MTREPGEGRPPSGRLVAALAVGGAVVAAAAALAWLARGQPPRSERPAVRSAAPRQVVAPGSATKEPSGTVTAGQEAPALSLPDVTGRMRSLREWRGQLIVLNAWASWCPPCLEEMPSLQALHERSLPGIAVVSICVDEDVGRARELVRRLGITFPVLMDPGGVVMQRWGTVKFPETWLVGSDGRVVDRVIGAKDWNGREMIGVVRAADEGR